MNQHTGPHYNGEWIREQIRQCGGVARFGEICAQANACKSTVARALHYGIEAGSITVLGRDYMATCRQCGDPTTNRTCCDDCGAE